MFSFFFAENSECILCVIRSLQTFFSMVLLLFMFVQFVALFFFRFPLELPMLLLMMVCDDDDDCYYFNCCFCCYAAAAGVCCCCWLRFESSWSLSFSSFLFSPFLFLFLLSCFLQASGIKVFYWIALNLNLVLFI